MEKNKNNVPAVKAKASPDIATLIDNVTKNHYAVAAAAGQMAVHAILTGLDLLALKRRIGYGAWTNFIRERLPFAHRTATNYMSLARNARRKIEFDKRWLRYPPAELPKADVEKLVEAVRQYTDGQSLTQMYIDLGIICDPQMANANLGGYHPRRDLVEEFAAEHALPEADYHTWDTDVQKVFREWAQMKIEGDFDRTVQNAVKLWSPVYETFAREINRPTWNLLPPPQKVALFETVRDLYQQMKKAIEAGGGDLS